MLYHGCFRYGWARLFVMFAVVFATGWIFESLSIETGFPFGNYAYSDLLRAKLGKVPYATMPAYFAMGFIIDIKINQKQSLIGKTKETSTMRVVS